MRLLVGLGNPGEKYAKTRHNAGFWCVDEVAKRLEAGSGKDFKEGRLYEARVGGGKVLLFKPMAFMNRSGLPVRQAAEYYGIAASDICVAYDDVYVQPGSVRIRRGGESGGHNGIRSLLEHLEPNEFIRLRIGVGVYEQHPERRLHQPPLDEYVLHPMPHGEEGAVRKAIDAMVPNLIEWLSTGELHEVTHHI